MPVPPPPADPTGSLGVAGEGFVRCEHDRPVTAETVTVAEPVDSEAPLDLRRVVDNSMFERIEHENAYLREQVKKSKSTGWNPARGRKLRMMEVFQSRFVHTMELKDTASQKIVKFYELMKELKWLPSTELMPPMLRAQKVDELLEEFPELMLRPEQEEECSDGEQDEKPSSS